MDYNLQMEKYINDILKDEVNIHNALISKVDSYLQPQVIRITMKGYERAVEEALNNIRVARENIKDENIIEQMLEKWIQLKIKKDYWKVECNRSCFNWQLFFMCKKNEIRR